MAKLMRGRKKRLILDVGTSAVRLCELSHTKTGYQLAKYLQREYNSDPQLDEEARKGLRRKALQQLLKDAKVRTRRTIFAVPGQSVFTRCRALPPVPEYKVTQIVKYEIQQQIPFSLDQIAMDYQVLDRTEAGGYDVMMAAIKTDVVDKHIDIILESKKSIDIVDVSPLAAYNWLKHTGEFGETGECVALIDLGATTTDIIIERENQFRFTRPLNVGGNDVTLALASAFSMNFSDAERLKRDRGFAPTGDPKKDGKGGEVIGQVLQRLVSEVMRSFSYFRSLPGGGQVGRVVLCGGGACLRGIIPYLQRQLGIEVRIAQPLAGLAIAPAAQQASEHPEQACIVLGLALRCRETVPIEINLIPPRILELARRKEQALYWALSLTAVAFIMASIIPVSANENKLVRQRIEALKMAIGAYDPELKQKIRPDTLNVPDSGYKTMLQEAKRSIDALKKDANALDDVRLGRTVWLEELNLINELRPSTGGIWFSSYETVVVGKGDGGGGGGGGRPGPGPGAPGGGNRARSGGPGGGGVSGFPGYRQGCRGSQYARVRRGRRRGGPRPGGGVPWRRESAGGFGSQTQRDYASLALPNPIRPSRSSLPRSGRRRRHSRMGACLR